MLASFGTQSNLVRDLLLTLLCCRASYADGKLKGPPKPCAGNQGTQILVSLWNAKEYHRNADHGFCSSLTSLCAGGGPLLQCVHQEESFKEPKWWVLQDCRCGQQVCRLGVSPCLLCSRSFNFLFYAYLCVKMSFCRYAIHNSGKSFSVKKVRYDSFFNGSDVCAKI